MNIIDEQTLSDAAEDFHNASSQCGECAAYHTTRPYLILAGENHGPWRDQALFTELLKRFAAQGSSILIAGSADAGLLEFICDVLGTRYGKFEVADRCPSPLQVCKRYAKRRGFDIATHERDLTVGEPFGQYDLIVSHLILSFLSPEGQRYYLRLMLSMLKPEGHLIVAYAKPDVGANLRAEKAERVLARLRHLRVPLPENEADFLARLNSAFQASAARHKPDDSKFDSLLYDINQSGCSSRNHQNRLQHVETHESISHDGVRRHQRVYVVLKAAR